MIKLDQEKIHKALSEQPGTVRCIDCKYLNDGSPKDWGHWGRCGHKKNKLFGMAVNILCWRKCKKHTPEPKDKKWLEKKIAKRLEERTGETSK